MVMDMVMDMVFIGFLLIDFFFDYYKFGFNFIVILIIKEFFYNKRRRKGVKNF